MRKATRAQWVKFAIVTVLYLAFLIWVKSWLGLIVLPFIFDIYISKKIPWGFWKKSENPAVRSVMSWVDAIVFALVAVYLSTSMYFRLSDTFFFSGEIFAGRRLSLCQQVELWSACAKHTTVYAISTTHLAASEYKIIHRVAPVGL